MLKKNGETVITFRVGVITAIIMAVCGLLLTVTMTWESAQSAQIDNNAQDISQNKTEIAVIKTNYTHITKSLVNLETMMQALIRDKDKSD